MNILLYIAAFAFVISVIFFFAAPAFIRCAGRGKRCTRKGTAAPITEIAQ